MAKLELLTKAIAAGRLDISVRRLMELSKDGELTRHRTYDENTKRETIMFDAAEVRQLLGARSSPAPAAVRAPIDYRAADAPARVSAALAVRTRPPLDEYDIDGPAVVRPWLTIGAAAIYSGLPASHLLEMIAAGELKARNVGPRPGGRWRVRKLDLDAIEGVSILISL